MEYPQKYVILLIAVGILILEQINFITAKRSGLLVGVVGMAFLCYGLWI